MTNNYYALRECCNGWCISIDGTPCAVYIDVRGMLIGMLDAVGIELTGRLEQEALVYADFGARLRRARLAHHLTQHALADKLGTSKGVVNQWEAMRRTPNSEYRMALVRLLGADALQ